MRRASQWCLILTIALGLFLPAAMPAPVFAVSPDIVISQVYGGGGNSGALYTNDFIELFNRGTAAVSLDGWSVQYTSATGTGNFGSAANLITPLSGSLNPGQYLLVQEAAGSTPSAALPTPDITDATPINMSGTGGKVALVNTTTPLGCNGSTTSPCAPAALATVVDLVGWGTANFFEGTGAAPATTNATAVLRNDNGCTDTDDNAADFTAPAPAPRNSASATNVCGPTTLSPVINEYSASTAGDDVEFVEIYGSPDTDYSAYTVLEIEGDSGSTIGTVDEVIAAGTTGAGGLWLANLAMNSLENGTITLLLVKDFTGALGNDLDTDNDGVFDVTPWSELVDAVAVNDGGAGDITYGVPALGVGYDGASFAPGGASRIPDGTDTDTAADWVRNDFDKAGITGFVGTPVVGEAYNTPGAPNLAVTVVDLAPTVASTEPLSGATGVAIDANLTVTFSEDVALGAGWYGISCSTSGAHTAAVSGGPTTWTLDPDANFAYSESCTVTIVAAQVTDLDGAAEPLAADHVWAFETAAPPPSVINEFSASTTGTDVEFVELYGPANMDYSAYRVLEIEGDAGNVGVVDEVIALGTADGTGFLLVNLAANALENGTLTLLLVKDFTGALGNDLDTNEDGVLDVTPWSELVDSVAVNDGGAGDITYGVPTLGVGYDGQSFAPGGASRIPDGTDTDTAADWVRNDFDLAGITGYVGTPVVGEAYNTPGKPNQVVVDTPPTVASTGPASGATGVAVNSDVTVTFSEPVTAAEGWYSISCATSGAHTAAVSGGPTTWTLNPDADFAAGESCTVTVFAAQVADQDGTPAAMTANYVWSFTVAEADICENAFTPIYTVQGSGAASPLAGTVGVAIEGIVVGDFQGTTGLNGFYVQDATGDADVLTSDGVFVYVPAANALSGVDVAVGDSVHLVGTVKEYNGVTQMDSLTALKICGTGSVAATVVDLPELVNDDLERYEGMLVTFPETLTVSQNYFQGRYGQVTLSSEGRMYNPTNGNGLGDTFELNARRTLVLDDGYSGQNPSPIPYIGADNTLRAGDTLAGLTGTLDYGPINATSPYIYDYRLQPTAAVSFTRVNARTAAPAAVGGNVKVASFNVLNYFTTLNARGANTTEEFVRQRTKIIAALQAIDADVVGLMEIENNGGTAVGDLVAGLNAAMGAGTYAYVTEPGPGTDEIKVAMIYKPAAVTPTGATQNYQTSTATYSPLYDRPPLAQTFTVAATGEKFTVMVNHFKSKGSCPAEGVDTDQGDGQGCWNAKRIAQAAGLLDFIAQLQAAAGDPDVLVIGDLNSYGIEDPINVLTGGGLINEVALVPAASRYTYTFDGFSGYLDHGLATPSLAAQVTGRTLWHINTDEPLVIDYNTEFKPQDLYAPTPYRSSDHDPVILGLGLYADLGDLAATYGEASHTGQGALRLGALWTGEATSVPAGDDPSDDGVAPESGFNWTADQGGRVSVTVTGGSGYLSGWADWNGDGVFDSTEALFTNQAVAAGPATVISFGIAEGMTVSGSYNLRFRLYPAEQVDPPAAPTGRAEGGEVEDYVWSFGPNAVGLISLQATAQASAAWPALGYGGGALLALWFARRRR